MASASKVSTKNALVSFNLLDLTFPVLRNFLDIMPLKDLFYLRQNSNTVNSLSHFRGEIVSSLSISTDNEAAESLNNRCVSYSKFMSQPFPTKPCAKLDVLMSSEINPEALLAKLEEQQYYDLYLFGEYHWKDVVAFLHPGVRILYMYHSMDLPDEDMLQFFNVLVNCKIEKIIFCYKRRDKSMLDAVIKTWNSLVGTVLKTVEFRMGLFVHKLLATTKDDTTIKFTIYVHVH